jgi:hypothetical protein
MMKSLFFAALALASADAATKVAVIELGPSGTVRRTTASYSETSAEGVVSFLSSLHGANGRRKLQHAGMTVVPDLFRKPDSGVVVSLSGVDLEAMPQVDSIMSNEGEHGVVGHMECPGSQSKAILKSIDVVEVDVSSLKPKVEERAIESGISGVSISVTTETASDVDAQVSSLIEDLQKSCSKSGKTIVLHLVVQEEQGAARRRLMSRRLEEGGENNEEQNQDEGNGEDNGDSQYSGYYGYGYYNAYGEWVTPYKTMFQIQYFNVVLWTSVGLVVILLFSLTLMVNMPLMADTLLFGESAKVPLDD